MPKRVVEECVSYADKYLEGALFDIVETDLSSEMVGEIRKAIAGRYPTFRRLYDDPAAWHDFQLYHLGEESLRKAEEPWLAAAALAVQPKSSWEWKLVEAWSWVYRHAALLDVGLGDFSEWLEQQDPDSSREFVTDLLMRSGRILNLDVAKTDRVGSDV